MKNDYSWIDDCADEISDLTNYNRERISGIIRRHLNKIPIEVKFYYMYDNCTYKRLKGSSIDEIIDHAIEVNEGISGLLCKPTIIYADKSERKVGESVHSHIENGFKKEELKKWKELIEDDEEVMGFFK